MYSVRDTFCSVLSFIVKTVLLFLCSMLVVVLSPGIPGAVPSLDSLLFLVSSFGAQALFAALFLALVSTHIRIVHKPGKKLLAFVLVFIFAFCILYGGLYGLKIFFPAGQTDLVTNFPLEKGRVTRVGEAFVWVAATDGSSGRLGPVVVMDRNNEGGNFRVYTEGRFDAKTPALKLLPGNESLSLHRDELENPGISLFVRFFTNDIAYITEKIIPKTCVDIPALAAVFSVVFFGLSLWFLIRLSRWPLFNLWCTLTAIWFVFSGSRLIGVFLVPELLRFESLAWIVEYLPVAFPGFCGFALFLAGLLGKPLEGWKREMRYE